MSYGSKIIHGAVGTCHMHVKCKNDAKASIVSESRPARHMQMVRRRTTTSAWRGIVFPASDACTLPNSRLVRLLFMTAAQDARHCSANTQTFIKRTFRGLVGFASLHTSGLAPYNLYLRSARHCFYDSFCKRTSWTVHHARKHLA